MNKQVIKFAFQAVLLCVLLLWCLHALIAAIDHQIRQDERRRVKLEVMNEIAAEAHKRAVAKYGREE